MIFQNEHSNSCTEYLNTIFSIRSHPQLFPGIDDSHSNRIHSSLIAVRCFDNGYVGKQPVVWKEYRAEYWLKELGKH